MSTLRLPLAITLGLLLSVAVSAQDAQQRRGFTIAITEPANQEVVFLKTRIIAEVKIEREEDLDRVEKMTEKELVEGAKKEEGLLWYTACPPHKAVLKAFQAKYSFVKPDSIYAGGPTIAQRFYADKQRGIEAADVFTSGLTEVYPDMPSLPSAKRPA